MSRFSQFSSAAWALFIALCLAVPGHTAQRDITLQWEESIDAPYLQSYKIYYYTTPGDTGSLQTADFAASYTLAGGNPIPINPLTAPQPITVDKSHTQITLHFLDNSKDYYFSAAAVDTRGLEGEPTTEISIMKLTVTKAGSQAGSVTGSPSGIRSDINCESATCRADYAGGSSVTLTAAPSTGNAFTGWSGGGCSGTGSCVVTISPALTVTATFMPFRTLSVVKSGTGTGAVTGTPSGIGLGIDCGTLCPSDSANHVIDTVVTLTAVPSAGNAFTGWSGGGCSGTGSCAVTMSSALTVTATFMPTRTLTVAKTGAGKGSVTGAPLGVNSEIDCKTACLTDSADYVINTPVTLTAVPDADSAFTGWSGGWCSGTGPCVLPMNLAKSATAAFVLKGDINQDGTVNLADAILALQILAGLNPPGIPTDSAASGTDVDGDGRIGAAEVNYILQKAAGTR